MFTVGLLPVGLASIFLGHVTAAAASRRDAPNTISAEFNQINSTFVSLTLANRGASNITLFGQNSPFDGAVQEWIRVSYKANGITAYVPGGRAL